MCTYTACQYTDTIIHQGNGYFLNGILLTDEVINNIIVPIDAISLLVCG